MKQVLVTGSNGFIGRHLIERLKKEGVKVVEFSREKGNDVTRPEDFAGLGKVETVFHLAAVSGYKDCAENTALAYEVNIGGTTNVLEYCRRTGAKLVFPSTYVYDRPYSEVKTETCATKATTHYSFTKFLGEELCCFYGLVFSVNSLILRTANVYGKGQNEIYIVPKLFKAAETQKKLVLTKPDVERSFIYVDDLVEAYIKLARSKTRPGEIFNIGPDHSTKLNDLIGLIEKASGKKIKVEYSGSSRPQESEINRIDNRKAKQKINWRPQVNLETGLNHYLEKLKRSNDLQ